MKQEIINQINNEINKSVGNQNDENMAESTYWYLQGLTKAKIIVSRVELPVKPESGGKIAEIRNLFTPILNMFTVAKEQRKYYLKVDKESRKQAVYLNKIEIAEKTKIMKNDIAEKIKILLDELG